MLEIVTITCWAVVACRIWKLRMTNSCGWRTTCTSGRVIPETGPRRCHTSKRTVDGPTEDYIGSYWHRRTSQKQRGVYTTNQPSLRLPLGSTATKPVFCFYLNLWWDNTCGRGTLSCSSFDIIFVFLIQWTFLQIEDNFFPMESKLGQQHPRFPMPYDVPIIPYAPEDTPFFMDYLRG